MDHTEFRVKAKEMVDYIADYLENIRERRVYPGVQPGYLYKLIPGEAPVLPEAWDEIFKDVEGVIMPGLVHWQSPHMHAYFCTLTSYPAIMGDMLSSALNVLCFTWASSPAGTELETIAMNWLGKMFGLPECFLNEKNGSPGGGVIQTTASESTLVSLLAARTRTLMELSKLNPDLQPAEMLGHLVAYCSDQAHSSVDKAGLIGLVHMRHIETDENLCMRGAKLEKAILSDKAKGLVPFWLCLDCVGVSGKMYNGLDYRSLDFSGDSKRVAMKQAKQVGPPCLRLTNGGISIPNSVCATLGTTGSVAFDKLREIGEVCEKHSAWLHVDAAYAGSAFVCPEYRHWMDGVELVDSFAFNPAKWLMVSFDCTAMWVKDSSALDKALNVNPVYLRHENSGKTIDYMHWQIPLGKRFRALKLWFVLRNYGISGIQKHIRKSVRLASKFEALVLADPRFEIPQTRNLGLVAFRLKGDNLYSERLLKRLNTRGYIHVRPACFKDIYVIRFVVTSQKTTEQDILDDWNEIKVVASEILVEMLGSKNGNIAVRTGPRVSIKETRELNATFGTSPLRANSPMSPKIANGTHAATTFAQLKMEPQIVPDRKLKLLRQKIDVQNSAPVVDLHQSNGTNKNDLPSDLNELQVPSTQSRKYHSKSFNVYLSGLKLDNTKISINFKNSEITITPTGSKKFSEEVAKVHYHNLDANEDNIGDKISQPFENFQDGLQIFSDYRSESDDKIEKDDELSSQVTIRGPGSYIQKLIQQFSEGPFEAEDAKPESERGQPSQAIKDRTYAICKKCLHCNGKITK